MEDIITRFEHDFLLRDEVITLIHNLGHNVLISEDNGTATISKVFK